MPPLEEFTGVFSSTRWTSPDRDYVIGTCEDGTPVKGPAEPGELIPNLPYRFFGKFSHSPRFGRQFEFVTFTKDIPHDREAVVEYLLRGLREHKSGIGHAKAHKLFDLYGSDAVRKLRMEPKTVAPMIGITEDQALRASRALDADAKIENTKIELIGLLAGKGFPKTIYPELITRWGAKAPSLIKRDAFLLLTHRFPGAGFSRVDNLYLSVGGDPARLKRQTLCAWHHLTQAGSGDTWHKIEEAEIGVRAKVDGVNVQPVKAVRLGIRSGFLAIRREPDQKWLADAARAENEASIAKLIARFQTANVRWPQVFQHLSPHQNAELLLATLQPIGILAGTPGTGKSFTAAAIIREIVKQHGDGGVEVVAPTGKAAVRLTEAMQKYGLNLKAKTIHRLLQPGGTGHTGNVADWGFRYNERNKLSVPFIVVDECSMIDTDLFASLLRACCQGVHILLVGDPYQLPPVGHGAPFRDLLAMPHDLVPRGTLTELRRNEGLIVEACSKIKSGDPFTPATKFDDSGNNLRVINVGSAAVLHNQIRGLYESLIAQGKRDPIEDVQILCALNEKSDSGRKKLNPFLQSLLNPHGQQCEKNKFRKGDKIICLTNGMYPSAAGSDQPPESIYNGEIGRVSEVDPTYTQMVFPDTGDGPRVVKIPTKGDWQDSFDLAYAITCHKSQGSEWPVVVIITDDAADRVCSREWHYTAISRAKERCIIFGRMATIGRQCRRVILGQRKTFLRELLEEEFSKQPEAESKREPQDEPQPASMEFEEDHGGSSWHQEPVGVAEPLPT